mgnify:CR=1 FL=1
MKIAFFEIKPEEKLFFQKYLAEQELSFFENTINEDLTKDQDYDVVSIFVHSRITNEILSKLPKLQYLQTRSTGYDHIKCDMLYNRGLVVSNVAGYGGPAVGEFAFSLLLNATRKTYTALERTKKSNFEYSDLKGIELYAKTLGILGLGTIGTQMARIGRGFGMNVLAYSRTKNEIIDELGIDFCDLESVLTQSDILMIALPLNPQTRYIINKENIKRMKKSSIIVNTSRAEIIEDSLYTDRDNIFCLDVINDVSYVKNTNILYTPHMAYYTQEALERILKISLENIEAFIEGKILPNCLKLACKRDYNIK